MFISYAFQRWPLPFNDCGKFKQRSLELSSGRLSQPSTTQLRGWGLTPISELCARLWGVWCGGCALGLSYAGQACCAKPLDPPGSAEMRAQTPVSPRPREPAGSICAAILSQALLGSIVSSIGTAEGLCSTPLALTFHKQPQLGETNTRGLLSLAKDRAVQHLQSKCGQECST
jgi:hypothetical protein